jgi:ABC-2 type transport system ATP-binding protein
MHTAVDVVDVSKRFRLYHAKYQSLKERVLHAGRNPYEDFWALRDVSFEVVEGETVGILGRNGSGKSTLLKCVSGILQPTNGKVVVRGQLAALLELGAGFQPDLTGRENIYLNASLLGLSTRDVEKRFDEIVAFAELEQFIDNQVRFYSSGMYVRLGFAVAVNVDPDVLVVDEVLAVGDENFQRKCLARIKEFQDDGRTILFVTHSPELVRQICDRAVVLEGGQILGIAGAGEAIHLYHERLLALGAIAEATGEPAPAVAGAGRRIRLGPVALEHPGSGTRPYLLPGEWLTVQVPFEAMESVPDIVFGITLRDAKGDVIFRSDTEQLEQHFDAQVGAGRIDFTFDRVPLLEGAFDIGVTVSDKRGIAIDVADQAARLEVMNLGHATGLLAMDLRAEIRSSILG